MTVATHLTGCKALQCFIKWLANEPVTVLPYSNMAGISGKVIANVSKPERRPSFSPPVNSVETRKDITSRRKQSIVFWTVHHFQRYLPSLKCSVTKHFRSYSARTTFAKSADQMIQRWNIEVTLHNSEIMNQEGKAIPQVDFSPRYSRYIGIIVKLRCTWYSRESSQGVTLL